MRLRLLGYGVLLGLMMDVAHAEVVLVVSADNPTQRLSRGQLADIYLGRMNRFPDGRPVTPVDQREGTPPHFEFYRDYLGQTPAQIKAHWSKLIFTGRGHPPRSVAGNEAVSDLVAESPQAIGYLEAGAVDERLRVVNIE